jgi:hypothetical protein
VWGDGIVPVVSAHLEGALNLTLEGAYHSPLGSVDEASSRAAVPGAEDDGAEPAEPQTTLDRLWCAGCTAGPHGRTCCTLQS